jgi:hypothetical protein
MLGQACFDGRRAMSLDIDQAVHFLNMLDPQGRHTIASEAPFGGFGGGPRWEQGQTHEVHELAALIRDVKARQARRSNVYYSVNRPCSDSDRQGSYGKNGVNDIIAIRALAFDVDFTVKKDQALVQMMLSFIDAQLTGALRPSLVIDSGGGFQLIYLSNDVINVKLFRPAVNSEQEDENEQIEINRDAIIRLAHEFETLLRAQIPAELAKFIKLDNMSNLYRVMRLPGTVNYPKAEKRARGQVEALAHIAVDSFEKGYGWHNRRERYGRHNRMER